ncbi:hypothetical protein [Peribacillus alkalitolerans]|uniref:hypothetical protein n=1 Tax=Peribacillus alkalitolerans TaxID=1550385 RepID=UPI0013CF9532|nr:hypothetical protein [Peribacillus alkalitolerans]
MGLAIGGIPVQGIISKLVETNREVAEQAVTAKIQEVLNDPAKNVREIQQSSPLSQFLDVKI